MAVATYMKRVSTSTDCVTNHEVEVHNQRKKARDEEFSTPSTPHNRKRKSTVTFSPTNDVFEFSLPTKEEKRNMHMSRKDQEAILREILQAIHGSDDEEPQQRQDRDDSRHELPEELCIDRILEQQDTKRIERVKSAICVILQRQRQSRLFPSSNPHQSLPEAWLEKHYRPFSKVSATLARRRGLQDQEMAPSLFPRKIVMSRV